MGAQRGPAPGAQGSFEQLGTPLTDVTFCVIDLETTGGSPQECGITEVGAMKVRAGEVLGTFHTLVDPGQPVPASIRLLTGISDELLLDAPDIAAVLPSLLEFIGSSVVVAHNSRFDVGFLNEALRRHGYEELTNKILDTALLARRILQGEVHNNKLETLARHLRCGHQPNHRAFQDVLATVDVLHNLFERVAGYGVTTLEDLVSISTTRMDGTFSKIKMTTALPRSPGIYRFLGPDDKVLYVGKATDLRARVRSYFYGDPRRKIRDLLRETQDISFEIFPTLLEAELAEAREIARCLPPYNRAGKKRRTWYLRVEPRRGRPRLGTARVPKADGSLYLGPLPSLAVARTLLDALQDAARIHRCTDPRRCYDCPFADMGTCSPEAQRAEMRIVAGALLGDVGPALEAIAGRMQRLARAERYEEAAEVRDRGSLLERSLTRGVVARYLREAGDVVIALENRALLIRDARVVARAGFAAGAESIVVERLLSSAPQTSDEDHLTAAQLREAAIVESWIKRSPDVRILHAQRPWVSPAGCRPQGLFSKKTPSDRGEGAQQEMLRTRATPSRSR